MKFSKLKHYYHIKEVSSTSLILYENIAQVSNLTFLSADYQSEGKGRSNHTWESEPYKNLLFSFVIKDPNILKYYRILSISIASIIAQELIRSGLENVKIKWPNDIYVKDKKICGILLQGNYEQFIICGVGVNVNQIDFNGLSATSIRNELGMEISVQKLEKSIYKCLKHDLKYFKYFPNIFVTYLRENNYLLGKEVSYEIAEKKYQGIAVGINDDGALIISRNGEKIYIDCGEVTLG